PMVSNLTADDKNHYVLVAEEPRHAERAMRMAKKGNYPIQAVIAWRLPEAVMARLALSRVPVVVPGTPEGPWALTGTQDQAKRRALRDEAEALDQLEAEMLTQAKR
ncbi:MAG: hypothetical protein ACRD0J_08995, partial [Acidimicrobiales bacterium]